jgi:hypothetical protein
VTLSTLLHHVLASNSEETPQIYSELPRVFPVGRNRHTPSEQRRQPNSAQHIELMISENEIRNDVKRCGDDQM